MRRRDGCRYYDTIESKRPYQRAERQRNVTTETNPEPAAAAVTDRGVIHSAGSPAAASRTPGLRRSFCRVCSNNCAILVEIENGRAVRVTGDPEDEVYGGYTCVKGRVQPSRLYDSSRLLHSMKRRPDGTFGPITAANALDEIAQRLSDIRDRHGVRALAFYIGTYSISSVLTGVTFNALTKAIGTPMVLSPNTIDQPGKNIAQAIHGKWMAPQQGFDDPEVAVLIGQNPLVGFQGAPFGNPGWLSDAVGRGMQLIVIDPRESETARRATLFLQPRPGKDAAIVAAMLRVILDEGRYDADFVAANVSGSGELRSHLRQFTPEAVARDADVDVDELVRAARIFADAKRGYVVAGTGPSMSGHSTIIEYLILNLQAICGRYLREGEPVRAIASLLRAPTYQAQAAPPEPARDLLQPMRVRGLSRTAAGTPVAAIPEEILLEGDGQIRALVSCAGNPAGTWPDQMKTVEALQSLELLVQIDPRMSHTARLANYVLAPKMSLECAGTTQIHDFLTGRYAGYGPEAGYANYTPPIVDAPQGSDLLEDWEFLYGIAQRLGLPLRIENHANWPMVPFDVDMVRKPTTDELLDLLSMDSRISLDEVRHLGRGRLYPEPAVVVAPKDEDWPHRLDVGNAEMMEALDGVAAELDRHQGPASDDEYPFRLISRRTMAMYNSYVNDGAIHRRPPNPAYMHPMDLRDLGIEPGDGIEMRSVLASIRAIVMPDTSLRRGLVSMSHGYGDLPGGDADPRGLGVNVSALIPLDFDIDPYSGQPRMSDLPIAVRPVTDDSRIRQTGTTS